MELTEDQIKEIVNSSVVKLKAEMTESLTQKLKSQVTDTATRLIREHVEVWVKENVIPEVSAVLTDSKAGLVQSAAGMGKMMCEKLAESMEEMLEEKLSKSWDRKKIFEAMFT